MDRKIDGADIGGPVAKRRVSNFLPFPKDSGINSFIDSLKI